MSERVEPNKRLNSFGVILNRQEEIRRRRRGLPVVDRVLLLDKMLREADPTDAQALTFERAKELAADLKAKRERKLKRKNSGS